MSTRRRSIWFWPLLAFTIVVCAFLIVPVGMSMLAGVTRNYFIGIESGVTLEWVIKVWTITGTRSCFRFRSRWRASCVRCCLSARGLCAGARQQQDHARNRGAVGDAGRDSRVATALALIVTFGNWGGFRRSWLIILVGTFCSRFRSWYEACWQCWHRLT